MSAGHRLVARIIAAASRRARLPWVFCLWLQAIRRIRAAAGTPRQPKTAVLVTDSVSSRVCKIAYGLKMVGWQTILLHRGEPPANPKKCFDLLLRYREPGEALFLATRFRPVVFHVFSNWHFELAVQFVRHRPGKIVFDNYDVLAGTLLPEYVKAFHKQIAQERFCLENADGLCCRDLETQCVKRSGYRFRGRRILFFDCCWGGVTAEVDSTVAAPSRSNDFHIVNCGNIGVRDPEELANHRRELTALAKTLAAQGLAAENIHFHIYSTIPVWSGALNGAAQENITVGRHRLFFHLHAPVPPDELQRCLREYDAGLYHFHVGPGGVYNDWKFAYTSGNRVFDYLDAGLPVIIHGSKFMEFLTRRAGVAIRVETELSSNARNYLQGRDVESLRHHARLARSSLAVDRHIPRLVAFYESL